MKITVFFLWVLLLCVRADAQVTSFVVQTGEDKVFNHQPVYADFDAGQVDVQSPLCLVSGGHDTPGQIERLADGKVRLWWIVDIPDGGSRTYDLYTDQNCNSAGNFYWERVREDATLLRFGNKPVIQYEHPVYNPDDIESTKKPYHHVFDPAGWGLITKGLGGLYPHHRGIYFGYYLYTGENRIEKAENDEDRIDIWHARNGERSEHSKILREFAGPVMGGHVLEILWKDRDGSELVREVREIRVFNQPNGETMIDFKTNLTASAGPIKLAGDRQHAGVQFRAAQYVADNPEATRYIRPESVSHLSPVTEIGGDEMYDLPWNAMQFTIGERTYTTTYFTHPDNPEGAEMSERLYGRFGEYIPHHLTNNNPLNLNYRFWITKGEASSLADINARHGAYMSPAKVTVR